MLMTIMYYRNKSHFSPYHIFFALNDVLIIQTCKKCFCLYKSAWSLNNLNFVIREWMVKSCISLKLGTTKAQRENAISSVELHNIKVCPAQQISFFNFCNHLQKMLVIISSFSMFNINTNTKIFILKHKIFFGSTITFIIEILTLP